ncbi:MAG: hypothetical protein IJX20_05250 [Alphaproteobacteria bacterium]|nr:hypothetical protein [Alphaproteobacteria bacterium]
MENLKDIFRTPIPSDVMDCVRYGSLCYDHMKSCNVWLRIAPNDETGKELPFNADVIKGLLKYGFHLCFDDMRQKVIKIGEHNLGKRDFFVAESMHGKKFIIFSCGMSEIYFIGIVAL